MNLLKLKFFKLICYFLIGLVNGQETFDKITYENADPNEQGLIINFTTRGIFNCLRQCSFYAECRLSKFEGNKCKLYNASAYQFISISPNGNLYRKKSKEPKGLVNHWPFDGDLLKDVVGGANLYDATNAVLTEDLFGNKNSAVYLNQGYLSVPQGVYFSGDFTVCAWYKLKSARNFGRLIDFGKGSDNDKVFIGLFVGTDPQPEYAIYRYSTYTGIKTSVLQLNTWYHITATLKGTQGSLYLNGELKSTQTLNVPRNIMRTTNYIGRSNWYWDESVDAIIDDLRIYGRSLSKTEINDLL